MRRPLVRPYLSATEPAIRLVDHLIFLGESDAIPGALEVAGWNPSIDLELQMIVEVDPSLVSEMLGISATHVRLGLVWDCPASQLRGSSSAQPLERGEQAVSVVLSGSWLGGVVGVTAVAFVHEQPLTRREELSPATIGSIVWESERREILLEGIAPQFPLSPVSFEKAGYGDHREAVWLLRRSTSDLGDAAGGALVIEINIDSALGRAAIEQPGTPEGKRAAEAIHAGVARQLVELALLEDQLTMADDYALDSLGAVYQGLIAQLGGDLDSMRSLLHQNKPALDARIQSIFGA